MHHDGKTKTASIFISDHLVSVELLDEGQKRVLFLWCHALIVPRRWNFLGNEASQFIVTVKGGQERRGKVGRGIV